MTSIRVALPTHLRTLARVSGEISVEVSAPPTIRALLNAVETRFPMLEGTIREHGGGERRAFIRYFACGADLSNAPGDTMLPEPVRAGEEPFRVIGAIAGG